MIVAVPVVPEASRPTRMPTPFWQPSIGSPRRPVTTLSWILAFAPPRTKTPENRPRRIARRGEAFDREAAELDVDAGTARRDTSWCRSAPREERSSSARAGADDRQALGHLHLLGEVAGAHLDPIALCGCGHGGLDRRVGRACLADGERRGRLRGGVIRPTKAETGEECDEPAHAFRQREPVLDLAAGALFDPCAPPLAGHERCLNAKHLSNIDREEIHPGCLLSGGRTGTNPRDQAPLR